MPLGEISIVQMPCSVVAINDHNLAGYHLDVSGEVFLRSQDGIAVWSEQNGKCVKVEGNAEARIVQTRRGPAVEISQEVDGCMHPKLSILCINLLAMAPASDRIKDYSGLLANARAQRPLH